MPEIALELYLLMLVGVSILGASAIALYVWRAGVQPKEAAQPAAAPPRTAHDLEQTGLQLVTQAAEILSVIHSQIAAGDRFSTSLAEAGKNLPKLSNPDQVRMVIKFLVAENAKMQQEASELKASLEQSRTQIEKLRSNLAQAEEVSLTDALTGAVNRRGYDLSIAKAIEEAANGKEPLTLIMCDLDHFKRINDTHGHPVGDEVLKIFCGILTENVRFGDTVARYGGEEFAVILTMTDAKGAVKVSERMRAQIASRRLALNRSGELLENITASFGIAQYVPGDTPASMIERADAKLYEAKANGRNRVIADVQSLAA